MKHSELVIRSAVAGLIALGLTCSVKHKKSNGACHGGRK
jgi:hypothetical protein